MPGEYLCTISNAYRQFLAQYDSRIPMKAGRPYYILQPEENGFLYAVPITTQIHNHAGQLKESACTKVLYDAKKQPVGALLYNNMFPVPPECVSPLPAAYFQQPYSLAQRQVISIRKSRAACDETARKTLVARTKAENPFIRSLCLNYRFFECVAREYAHVNGLTSPAKEPAARLPPHVSL